MPFILNPFRGASGLPATGSKLWTIDHTKFGTTDHTDFVMTVHETVPEYKSIANGGALTSVNQIVWYESDHTTLCKFEREKHDLTTGEIVYHIKRASISHTTDTLGYRDYDATTTDRSDAANVWTNSFVRVAHMGDGSSLTGHDSSPSASDFTVTNATAVSGSINGAGHFTLASNQYLNDAHAAVSGYPLTITARVKLGNTTFGSGEERVIAAVVKKSGLDELWLGYLKDGSGNQTIRCVQQTAGSPGYVAAFVPGGFDTSYHTVSCRFPSSTIAGFHVYMDGSDLSINGSGSNGTPTGLSDTYIGAFFYNTSNFYSPMVGDIANVRFASADRSSDWLLAEHNVLSNPSGVSTFT